MTEREQATTLRTHVFNTMSATVAGIVTGALATVVAPRLLGQTEFGRLSWGLTLVYVAAAACGLGLPLALTALAGSPDDPRDGVHRLLPAAAVLVLVAGALTSVATLAVGGFAPSVFGSEMAPLAWIAALCIAPSALLTVSSAGMRVVGRFGRAAVVNDVSARLCLLLGLTVAWVTHSAEARTVLIVLAGSLWMAVAVAYSWAGSGWHLDVSAVRFLGRRTLPFYSGSMAATLIPQAGVLVLGPVDDPGSVAHMALAIRIMLVCSLGSIAGSRVVGPRVVATRTSPTITRNLMVSTATLATWITFVLSAPFIFGGYWLVPVVFGSSFREAWIPTAILLIGLLYSTATGFAGQLLYHSGHQRQQSRRTVIGAAGYVIACFPAAQLGGATGVAIVSAATAIILNELQARHARRAMHFSVRAQLGPSRLRPALDHLATGTPRDGDGF